VGAPLTRAAQLSPASMDRSDGRRVWRRIEVGALTAIVALVAIAGLLAGVLVLEHYDCERCRARRKPRGG
jgi:hypothetical protein